VSQITLDLSDAAELAETLAFTTGWLSGSQEQIHAESLAAFAGHPAYGIETLAPTCTGSYSSPASATTKNSSASRRHDHRQRHGAPA
jgi:hypothetical protein